MQMKNRLHSSLPLAILALSLSLVGACRTNATATDSKLKDATYIFEKSRIQPVSCKDGDPYYFMLMAGSGQLPGFTELKIPQFSDPSDIPGVVPPKADKTIRLDLCVKDDVVTLQKVLLFQGGEFFAVDVVASSKITGLNELFFNQDYTNLRLELPIVQTRYDGLTAKPMKSKDTLLVLGSSTYKGAYWATIGLEDEEVVLQHQRDPIVFGVFETSEDGGVATDECSKIKGNKKTSQFTIETATFTLDACYTGIMKEGPSILRLSVTDTSVNLDSATRGKTFEVAAAGIASTHVHHWACENLVVTLPHAVYGMTSSSTALSGTACPTPLTGSPARSGREEGLAYSFKYAKSGKVVQGVSKARQHFAELQ